MKKEESKSAVPQAEVPAPARSFEVARSQGLDLRSMRQISLSLWASIHMMSGYKCEREPSKTMTTAEDVMLEYNHTLRVLDAFYEKARHGIGDVKVYLVAESAGFTKQMEISIKDKDELTLAR